MKYLFIILLLLLGCETTYIYDGTETVIQIEMCDKRKSASDCDRYKYLITINAIPENVKIYTNTEFKVGETVKLQTKGE